MTDTNTLAPTDAEIDALLRHFYESDEAAEMAKHDDRLTARAVLAKWGAQPVAAPVGMEPTARIRYERNTPGRENEMPRVLSCNRMTDGVYEVFTTSQVQAMLAAARKPLTDEKLHALYADEMAGHFVDALHY